MSMCVCVRADGYAYGEYESADASVSGSVYASVYVPVLVYVCASGYAQACVHVLSMYADMLQIDMYVYTHMYVYLFMHVRVRKSGWLCVNVCMYACMHACMHACIYV